MLIVRASVWMKAERKFTNPNSLHHDHVLRVRPRARTEKHELPSRGARTTVEKSTMNYREERNLKVESIILITFDDTRLHVETR